MNKLIKKKILEICPSDELKECLCSEDYEEAIVILESVYVEFDAFPEEFSFFDWLEMALEEESVEELRVLFAYSEKLFFLEAAKNLLALELVRTGDNPNTTEEVANNYFINKCYVARAGTITEEEIDEYANYLIKNKNKKYPKTQALHTVLSFPIDTECPNDDLVNVIEGWIHGSDCNYWTLMVGLLTRNFDSILEEMELLRNFREQYWLLSKDRHDELQAQVNLIRQIGLIPDEK